MDYMHSNGPLKRQNLFMDHTTKAINIDDPIPLEDVNESDQHYGQKDGSIYFEDKTILLDERSFCDVASRNEFSSNQSQQNIRNTIFEINNKLTKHDEKSEKSKRTSINQQRNQSKQQQSEITFLCSPQKISKVQNLNEIQQIQEETNNSSKYNNKPQKIKQYKMFQKLFLFLCKQKLTQLLKSLLTDQFRAWMQINFNRFLKTNLILSTTLLFVTNFIKKMIYQINRNLKQICVNLQTRSNSILTQKAIFRKGQIIRLRKIIINTFMKEQLIYTVLGMIGIILSKNVKYCKMLFLIRSLQIPIIYREIESKLNIRIKMKHQSELLKLIFFILSVAHLVGCSFRFVGLMEISQGIDKTWLKDDSQSYWVYQYANCIYQAVVTMVTLGYGDITPLTIAENFFTIFIVLISCGVFGYCINQVGMIIQSIGKERENFNLTMDKLNIFMKERKFNLQIQMKIRKHFEYKFRIQNKNSIQIDQLLDQMHESLKYETLKELYNKMIQSTSIFFRNFSEICLDELSQQIKEINLVPDEYLYQAGEQSDLIYFVLSGEFTVIPKDDQVNRVLSVVKKGSLIGQYEFISQIQREFSVKSRDFCNVAAIDYQSFIKVLQKYPKDYEKFCYIKDNIQFCCCLNETDIKCSFCQVNDHTINYCKKYQFIPNILNKIKNQKSTIQIQRQQFCRKKKFKWNTFKNIYQTSFYTNQYTDNYLIKQKQYQQNEQSDSSLSEDTSSQIDEVKLIDSQNQIEQQYVTQTTQNQKRTSLQFDDIISPTKKNLRQVGPRMPSTTQIKENETRTSTKKISFILSTNDIENFQEIQLFEKNNSTEKAQLHAQLDNMFKSEKSPTVIRKESGKKDLTIIMSQNKFNQTQLQNQSSQSSIQPENNDFDQMKDYKIYFPTQNCVSILKEYNFARKKKLQKMKVQTKNSFSMKKMQKSMLDQKNNKTSRTSLPSQIQSLQFLQK